MDTVCFDVGGTYIKYALVSNTGKILEQSKIKTPDQKRLFQQVIVDIVDRFALKSRLNAVGISMPGYINPKTGYAERAGALAYLDQTNLIELLSERIALPIYIENDANCAALAERYSGNAQETENFIVMTIGTGIGTALFLNGQLYRGASFKAGEYGHSRINFHQQPDATMHEIFSTRVLVEQYKELLGINSVEHVTGEAVFESAQTNPAVEALLKEWVQWICVGIYNLACTLNPNKILIGGGVSANPELIPRIQAQMKQIDERWLTDFNVPIEPCRYLNDAGILGAYYFSNQQLEKSVKER